MEPTNYRHGDVMLKPASLQKGLKKVYEGTSFVAQEGETTGHRHLVASRVKFTVWEGKGGRYFSFGDAATITHEEHKALTIEKGVYVQSQEQEKDWFSLSTRQVID